MSVLSHCSLILIASIPSAEFKGMFGLKQDNKGQLTWRQKNNVFSAILGIRCMPFCYVLTQPVILKDEGQIVSASNVITNF